MCGVAAIIPNKGKNINWSKAKLLLLLNEERGKQSTGLATLNGSLKALKAASSFLPEILITQESAVPVLLQTRAPSMGMSRSIDAAQPIIENDDSGDIEMLLVHNGTIHNMEELAAEFEVEFSTSDTDSQILSKLILNHDYSVLDKYYGAASLIWTRKDDEDALYVFRGESSNSNYGAPNAVEERPLHVGYGDDGVYFSSTAGSLESLFDTKHEKATIQEVDANIVFRYTEEESTIMYEADRSNVSQIKPHTPSKSYTSNRNYDMYSYGYEGYDDVEYKVGDYNTLDYKISNPNWVSVISEHHTEKMLVDESINGSKVDSDDIFFYRGLYRKKSHVLNGDIYIKDGKISYASVSGSVKFSFVKGVMLKRTDMFVNAYAIANRLEYGTLAFKAAISSYAAQPVIVLNEYKELFTESLHLDGALFTGVYTPLFKPRGIVEAHNGKLAATVFHVVSKMKIGDLIYVVINNMHREGIITDINLTLSSVEFLNSYGANNVTNECYITKWTPTQVEEVVDMTPIKPTEDVLAEERAQQRKDALKKVHREQSKVRSDIQVILKDSQEELQLQFTEAKKIGVRIPKINKRVYNLMTHAIKSLTVKQN